MNKYNTVKKNIIEFKRDGDFYFERAEKFLLKGDYLSALENMRKARRLMPEEPYFAFRMARIYGEMGLPAAANDIYFRLITQKKCVMESYFGLTQNFMEDDNLEVAYHYLKCAYDRRGGADGDLFNEAEMMDMDIDDLYDIIEELEDRTFDLDNSKGLKLVYDRDIYQKKILLSANNLMGRQEFDKALTTFAVIKPDSNFYNEALNGITLCHYLAKNYVCAEAVAKEAERLYPDDAYMLCNRLLLADKMRSKAETEKYLSALLAKNDLTDNERYRAAMVFCETDRHGYAAEALEKLLEETPYDPQVLLLCAQAQYNGGNLTRAAALCRIMIKADEDDSIARYYLKLFTEGPKRKVSYACQVPQKEIVRRLNILTAAAKPDPSGLCSLIETDNEFFRLVKWCMTLDDIAFQTFIFGACCGSGSPKIREYIDGLLLSSEVNTLLKKQLLIKVLSKTEGQRTIHLTADDILLSARYNAPKKLNEFPACFIESYINVFATLALMEKGFEVKLNSVVREFLKCAEAEKDTLKDSKALSAVIGVMYGGKRLFTNRGIICEIFNTNLTTLRAYMKKLGLR